jgi:hypothetical protein
VAGTWPLLGHTGGPLPSDPQAGDIVVYQERDLPCGPCVLGALGAALRTPWTTYAEALKEANKLAMREHVDVWTTYRVRWADAAPPSFRRLATRRPRSSR